MVVNRVQWLTSLAAAYNERMSQLQIEEYLDVIRLYELDDEQWAELKREAKKRCQFFPRTAEIDSLVLELKRNKAAYAVPAWETFEKDGVVWARRRKEQPAIPVEEDEEIPF